MRLLVAFHEVWLGEDARIFQRTILTAEVAAEFYAGSHSLQEKRALDEPCQAHRALAGVYC
jgi:hypothetical protein